MNLPSISYSENYFLGGNAHNNNIVVEFPSIRYCENVGFIAYTNFHLITLWKTVGFQVLRYVLCQPSQLKQFALNG
jgi:hypothetical protein